MTQIPLIIDCDTGVDDAVALLLAFASPELDLIGITTVAGNVSAVLTARNTQIIRQIAGRQGVPIHAGCERPILRDPVEAGDFHGTSGLGSLPIFEPPVGVGKKHAVQFLIDEVMQRPPRTVTLAVTGPMTNVAMAMILEPAFAGHLKGLVVMGGARLEGGNITASAEFNIFADPHAAQIVIKGGAPMVWLGLDATHQVRGDEARIAAIAALGTPAAQAAANLLTFNQQTFWRFSKGRQSPLHDPCTIAYLINPGLFTSQPATIEVECASGLTLGHTAVEFRVDTKAPAQHAWVTKVDGAGVFALLTQRLGHP